MKKRIVVDEQDKRIIEQDLGWKKGSYDAMMQQQLQAENAIKNSQQSQQSRRQQGGHSQARGKGKGKGNINQKNINKLAREQQLYLEYKKQYPNMTLETFEAHKRLGKKKNKKDDGCAIM